MYYIKAQVNNSIYAAVADTDLLDLRTMMVELGVSGRLTIRFD